MKDKLLTRFQFKPGEFSLVFTLGVILLGNYAAMGITKVIAVSGFLSEVKGQYLLLLWAGDMALLILATGLQSLIIDRFDRIKLLMAVLLVFMGLYATLALSFFFNLFSQSFAYTLIYLLNDQQWRFFPVVFWILANDIFDPAAGRRLLPVIANFAFVGTILGLGIGGLDASMHFGPVNLLYLNAIIFLAGFAMAYFGLRQVRIAKPSQTSVSIQESFSVGWDFIKTVPAFAYQALVMVAAGVVMTVLLYDAITEAHIDLGSGFQSFYANYNLLIAVVSIIVQSLTRRIIEKLTVKNSFVIHPIVMMISTITSFFIPGFLSSTTAQGVSRVSYDTIDLSNRKAVQALVPNEKRGRVSMFIDGHLPSLGTIIGSLITFGIITAGLNLSMGYETFRPIYLGLGIVLSLCALWAALRVRKTYDKSMLNWQLKRRTRGSSGMLDKLEKPDLGDR